MLVGGGSVKSLAQGREGRQNREGPDSGLKGWPGWREREGSASESLRESEHTSWCSRMDLSPLVSLRRQIGPGETDEHGYPHPAKDDRS
jgi:hypothetical protein